ncbi:MAG: hypothetical protein A2X18_09670 [Bacteroidetes bacterium GWF2_40_14]|nr:MAG: hypothetical protein A2X18_09670 [Bacteroidetes bacterium GWF2_40_14]
MKTNIDMKMTSGYVMASIGFAFLLLAALNYIFDWKLGAPPVGIGIVFLGAGAARIRKSRNQTL